MNISDTQPNWKHYTVGFYFNNDLTEVLLIRKAKPAWQAGRLNGIGGSFEGDETAEQCMEREFLEETGNDSALKSYFSSRYLTNKWKKFGEGEVRVHQGDCFLHYMVMKGSDELPIFKVNNEECVWVEINKLPTDAIPNLHFLIPMAKNVLTKPWWSEMATFRTLI